MKPLFSSSKVPSLQLGTRQIWVQILALLDMSSVLPELRGAQLWRMVTESELLDNHMRYFTGGPNTCSKMAGYFLI
jgi:hypothetical protein